jgi:uncharacterized protein YbjT (DUF2867 family)
MNKRALLAGATGLVGRELLEQLVASSDYGAVHVLVRRAAPALPPSSKLVTHVVSFDDLRALPTTDDVFVALGTTIKVAGSQEAFRRVDHDYVLAVARAGRLAGARRLGIVSALGAAVKSRVFYNRVKGEMQLAVAELGYDSVVIAQPSLLVGNREALGQPPRAGEVWARRLVEPLSALLPARVRPVRAGAVASALLRAVLTAPPGVSFVENSAMQ